ncbi:hypothetical protein NP568_24755, partial [Vibrio parahaemolyticus]|nr:hypothetical protein [Vibrio parahaemolyticus]
MESSGAGLPKQVLAVTEALCSTILSVRNGYSAYVLWVYWVILHMEEPDITGNTLTFWPEPSGQKRT